MEQVENRMVVEWQWPDAPQKVSEKLNGPGCAEIGSGIFVPEEDAYEYALERVSQDEDLKQEFVEWFYSGNWIKED